jgi:membrane fusion protein, multidrug efflux system
MTRGRLAVLLSLGLCLPLLAFTESASQSLVFDTTLFVENDVEIKTRLTGIIEEIFVDRGKTVTKGTPLAQLQNEDLKLEMEKAKATMQESEAAFTRAKSLYDQQLLSAAEYDEKRLAFDRAKTESEIARVNYDKSIIVAPFSGVIVERFVRLGQRVVEDDNVALFRITALSPLLARIYVQEDQLGKLSPGKKAEFIPNTSTSKKYSARIKWISSVIDAGSGMAPVILEILGATEGQLKPGTSGKVIISSE